MALGLIFRIKSIFVLYIRSATVNIFLGFYPHFCFEMVWNKEETLIFYHQMIYLSIDFKNASSEQELIEVLFQKVFLQI